MKRIWLCILVLALLLTAVAGCGGADRNGQEAVRFLGPLPGTTYEYTGPDGLRMEAAGMAWQEKGTAVLVRETAFFPPDALPPEFMGKASEREYVFLAQGSRLVMDVAGNQTVMADFSGDGWTIPVMTTSFSGETAAGPVESDWVIRDARCRMIEHGQRILFGASREVVTVDCSLAVDQDGSRVVMQAADLDLAEGVGVVRMGGLELTAIHGPDE